MPNPVWYLLLWAPGRIERRLDALHARGVIPERPSLWQVWMGVLYMWTRVVLRPDTIGLSDGEPVRTTPGAERLQHRAWRLPALLKARAVNPLDQVGLGSSREHLLRHLVGAYHPGDNFLYDLQILDVEPGGIDELWARTRAIVDETDPDAVFYKDLVVYDGYHERLLAAVEAWRDAGRDGRELEHPDTTLPAFMAWCARRPDGLAETLAAMRQGDFTLLPDL